MNIRSAELANIKMCVTATTCGRKDYCCCCYYNYSFIYSWFFFFFFYSRGFVFISRFLQWVCLILNETKPTYDTIGGWAVSVGPFCAKGKCKGQSAGSAVDVGRHCRDRKVFIFLVQSSNGSRVLTRGPRWRVAALRRLQVKSPFVAILGQKKKRKSIQTRWRRLFFISFRSLCRQRLHC